MRSLLFLGLAACWPAAKPPDKPAHDASTAPVTPAVAAAKVEPAKPKLPSYVLPKRAADALGTEPLAGNVLVPAAYGLQPSAAAARADAEPARGKPIAMAVVRDHGDVVELSTARVADCVENFVQPYELTVFVKRDKLIPRSSVDVTKAFTDGTAVAIDRGAPVEISPDGLAWHNDAFTATKVLPSADHLTYAVPAGKQGTAPLPQLAADPLVCEKDRPMTKAEWEAARRAEREAKMREKQEQRRAELERRRAELERTRPERERRQKERAERERKECEKRERERAAKAAKAATQQPKKPGPKTAREQALEQARTAGIIGTMSTIGTCDISAFVGSADLDSGIYDLTAGEIGIEIGDRYDYGHRFAPYCGVHDPADYHDAYGTKPKATPPSVNGNPLPWPSYYDRVSNEHVVKHGASYLADIGHRCGRVRVAVEAAAVRRGGAGGIGGMHGGQVQVWIPKPGPVTWPDGSPAGRFTGSMKYREVVDKGDRICVRVSGVAELVCHDKKTTTTGMGSRFGT